MEIKTVLELGTITFDVEIHVNNEDGEVTDLFFEDKAGNVANWTDIGQWFDEDKLNDWLDEAIELHRAYQEEVKLGI